ncbi:hypothetical protein D9611_000826 [Ephemerocybe angulata]|uniref:non-specific serine/threonine protein kinase n=1 Tax=Ephemerocybe angulata TaxID=980116 RepID=A0A8H5BMM1_9AGAR|nr:hypothetical protein D9611_000826 [Tulosesus angulatus]
MAALANTPTNSLRRKTSFMTGGAPNVVECLGYHRGAIDTTTISNKPPPVIMNTVRRVLGELGIQVQEESAYNYRCIRARKQELEPAAEESLMDAPNCPPKGVYGPLTEDPGDEVRMSIELTRLEGLNDTYSLDIRRLKGNLRSYKFLYDTIRDISY